MSRLWFVITLVLVIVALYFISSQDDRDQTRQHVRVVGSSTVFPFATVVAETVGRRTTLPTPIIESTGTGGGFKQFCGGIGEAYPDISNASRRLTVSETAQCERNGVTDITEVIIGYDGIVLAHVKQSEEVNFTMQEIFLALAQTVPVDGQLVANPFTKWSDIAPHLPNQTIVVYGPPTTSGTRDSFVELVMRPGCNAFPQITALAESERRPICDRIREDGPYVTAGENDNLIIQKLRRNAASYGIFGFSFLVQNSDIIQGTRINNIQPNVTSISAGTYQVARPLFFYIKEAHIDIIPGVRDYITEFTNDRAFGTEGYLVDKGLIPLPDEQRIQMSTLVRHLH